LGHAGSLLESDGNRGVGSNSSDDYDEMSMFWWWLLWTLWDGRWRWKRREKVSGWCVFGFVTQKQRPFLQESVSVSLLSCVHCLYIDCTISTVQYFQSYQFYFVVTDAGATSYYLNISWRTEFWMYISMTISPHSLYFTAVYASYFQSIRRHCK
jgi:hypothetical protein